MSRRLMQPCADTILAKGTDQDKYRFLLERDRGRSICGAGMGGNRQVQRC